MKKHSPAHITAYFDFSCPWSYLARVRVQRALKRWKVNADMEWVPFELYEHHTSHTRRVEKIAGHEHLNRVYAHLHELASRENILILRPQYEASSRRALTGFLYAQQKGVEEKYLDELFAQTFEHTANISSPAVLRRIAIKLGFDPAEFLSFVENPANQKKIEQLTREGKQRGVRGLPTYWINHLPVVGALGVNDWGNILRMLNKGEMPAYMIESKKGAPRKKVKQVKKRIKREHVPHKKKRKR